MNKSYTEWTREDRVRWIREHMEREVVEWSRRNRERSKAIRAGASKPRD